MFELDRLPKPDEYGFFCHPDVPGEEESDDVPALCADAGWECSLVSGDDIVDEGSCEYDATKWTPEAPAGDGWLLVAVYDTEDGPYAMFVKPNANSTSS
ncbi:MAG: hypothetical protein WC710_13415 [Gallionella sp.]